MEELVIGDKTYVSSKRASEITGYAKDYIGQLCREGRVQATLVGRSWYVLESSIREHRFGAPEATPTEEESTPVAPGIGLTWTPPVYVPEPAAPVEPEPVKSPGVNAFEATLEPQDQESPILEAENVGEEAQEEKSGVLENMQSAWQDWFKSRGEKPEEGESEYGSEAQNAPVEPVAQISVPDTVEEVSEPVEEASTPVNISMIEEPEEQELAFAEEESVPLYRVYEEETEAPTEENPYIYVDEMTRTPQRSSYVARSLILVVAGVAVLIAFIGTGSFDFIAKKGNGIQAGTIYYFSGTQEIK